MVVTVIGDDGTPSDDVNDFDIRLLLRNSGNGVVVDDVEKRTVYGLANVIGCLLGDAVDVNCGIVYLCGFLVEY